MDGPIATMIVLFFSLLPILIVLTPLLITVFGIVWARRSNDATQTRTPGMHFQVTMAIAFLSVCVVALSIAGVLSRTTVGTISPLIGVLALVGAGTLVVIARSRGRFILAARSAAISLYVFALINSLTIIVFGADGGECFSLVVGLSLVPVCAELGIVLIALKTILVVAFLYQLFRFAWFVRYIDRGETPIVPPSVG